MKFGLSESILDELTGVFARYSEIERVLIFGSRAKGTFRDGSDIDLAIFAPNISQQQIVKLWMELDGLPILFKMDVLHWDNLANTRLKDKILQEGRVLYLPQKFLEQT